MEDVIKEFLKVGDSSGSGSGDGFGFGDGSGYGSGSGFGFGDGSGYGDGFGFGYGSGYGDGSGYGSGDGFGYGSGDGSGPGYVDGSGFGLRTYNGIDIHEIDCVATGIERIKNGVAIGFILNSDLTTEKTFVVKRNNLFAHGKTVRLAMESLEEKMFEGMNVEERIDMFMKEFKLNVTYPTMEFFSWHNKLTGSCLQGRENFAKNHMIDLDGEMTVEEFISLTENDFGGSIIRQLKEQIGLN